MDTLVGNESSDQRANGVNRPLRSLVSDEPQADGSNAYTYLLAPHPTRGDSLRQRNAPEDSGRELESEPEPSVSKLALVSTKMLITQTPLFFTINLFSFLSSSSRALTSMIVLLHSLNFSKCSITILLLETSLLPCIKSLV